MVLDEKTQRIIRSAARDEVAFQELATLFEASLHDARLWSFMNSPVDSIFTLGEDGIILNLNDAAATTLADKRENLLGTSIFDYSAHELLELRRKLFEDVIRTQSAIISEGAHNGRWFHTVMFPVVLADGTHAITIVGRDITDHKAAEDARIAEINRLKTHREEAMRRLQYGMMERITHEFRQPLSVILTSAHMLEHFSNRLDADKQTAHFALIKTQVHYVDSLLQDIVAVLETHQTHHDPEEIMLREIDLVPTLQEVIRDIVEETGSDHHVVTSSETPHAPVYLDAKHLKTIMIEVICNAVKFSPTRTKITVTVSQTDDAFTLTVADQGIGIPADDMPYIFDPFYRGSNLDEQPGMGLGLVKVKAAVNVMDGSIRVESEGSHGTTFFVTLPKTLTTQPVES